MEFYIDAAYRRCGLGGKLLRMLELEFINKDINMVWITANKSAEKFWKAKGFIKTGKKDTGNGFDIMTKKLES